MTSALDNLARPANPDASRHLVKPSPRYCLCQSPVGAWSAWYLVPYIYEYGFTEWCKEWTKEHVTEHMGPDGSKFTWYHGGVCQPPAYAVPVDITRLTFEKPIVAPY